MSKVDPAIYTQALLFAIKAHGKQMRKGSHVPYITHPVAVSAILAQYGFASHLVLAGLLHDVVEDTAVTITQICEIFGPKISQLVAGVTERKVEKGQLRCWEERKAEQLAVLKVAELDVVALRVADVLHNVLSIHRDLRTGCKVWDRFNRGRESQIANFKAVAAVAKQRLGDHPMVRELEEAVATIC